jgi:hypothetical protein
VGKEYIYPSRNLRFLGVFFAFFLIATGGLSALDTIYAGLGLEVNENSRNSIAAAGILSFGLELDRAFDAGAKIGYSYGADALSSLELQGVFRYKIPFGGPFLQAELGYVVFNYENKTYGAFLGGLAFGWRFLFAEKWYLEPVARLGYPYIWGLGLSAGIIINLNKGGRE